MEAWTQGASVTEGEGAERRTQSSQGGEVKGGDGGPSWGERDASGDDGFQTLQGTFLRLHPWLIPPWGGG